MEGYAPKKLAPLHILQILDRYSDETHPLKQDDIARILFDNYGVAMERKAIGRNISMLRDAGIQIESDRNGSYRADRLFSDPELRILIDGVLSSKCISKRYSADLIDKLCSLSNVYFSSHVKHIHSVGDWDRSENRELFYDIGIVDAAVEKCRKISFEFYRYGTDKKLRMSNTHTVSPYQLILRNQRYFLMARDDQRGSVSFFRLDRIRNMKLTEYQSVPLTENRGYENGINYAELSTALPYMYSDRPEPVEFEAESSIVDQVIDWFGKDIAVKNEKDGRVNITVKSSPMAMKHWAMQYAPLVRIISPQKLADEVKRDLKAALEAYG